MEHSFYTPHGLKIRLNKDFFYTSTLTDLFTRSKPTMAYLMEQIDGLFSFTYALNAAAFLISSYFCPNQWIIALAFAVVFKILSMFLLFARPKRILKLTAVFYHINTLLTYAAYIAAIALCIYNRSIEAFLWAVGIKLATNIVFSFLNHRIIWNQSAYKISDAEYIAFGLYRDAVQPNEKLKDFVEDYMRMYNTVSD